ncbi:MAG: hypothetical protein ONA90_01300 [candidate division KSB1 bacterium]|nr:hypothetical protein [candidate division KSB1 bacterium]
MHEVDFVINALSTDAFWSVNKRIAREVGIEETVLLSELIYRYRYFQDTNRLHDGEAFYATSEDLQSALGIGKKTLERIVKSLLQTGLVSADLRGVPARRYWFINWRRIYAILSSSKPVRSEDGENLISQNGITSYPQMGETCYPQMGTSCYTQMGQTIFNKKTITKKEKEKGEEKKNKSEPKNFAHDSSDPPHPDTQAAIAELFHQLAKKTQFPFGEVV